MNQNTPLNDLSGTGYLIIHVTTARGSLPLEGALVTVRNDSPQEQTQGELVATLISGPDGNTELLPLPTHPRSESLVAGNPTPYSTYLVEARLEGYSEQTFIGVPIFDGIIAIQPVNMIPLPESGQASPSTPEDNLFYETQSNTL